MYDAYHSGMNIVLMDSEICEKLENYRHIEVGVGSNFKYRGKDNTAFFLILVTLV